MDGPGYGCFGKIRLIAFDTVISESLFLPAFHPASVYFLDCNFSWGKAEVFRPLAVVLRRVWSKLQPSPWVMLPPCVLKLELLQAHVFLWYVCVCIYISFLVV